MRLICPNCGAQYEVPVDVIPAKGRDVQCSNCGHTWFQRHPDDDAALAEDLDQPVPDTTWAPEDDDEPPTPPPAPESPQRRLDPSVAEVLREEAAREARQRAADAGTLESQPDLGLEEPDEDAQARRAREARTHMARLRGPAPERTRPRKAPTETAAAAAVASRSELLPDVEEINQTLRASSQPRVIDDAKGRAPSDRTDSRGGFGRGFLFVVVLVALAIAVYILAPRIAEQVPALAPLLDAYVGAINAAWLWIDTQVKALLTTLDGMSSETTAPEPSPAAGATDPDAAGSDN